MPSKEKSNPLGTVTHLFLSNEKNKDKGSGKHAEAVIWLAVSGSEANRAFLSVGFAEAFSNLKLHVTLLELCLNLPNIGYYFALEPVQYLLSVVENEHIVAGRWDERLDYISARAPSAMISHKNMIMPVSYPHLLFFSFTFPSSVPDSYSLFEIRKVSDAYVGAGNERVGIPDVVVVVGEDKSGEVIDLIENVREVFPDTIIFQVSVSHNGKSKSVEGDSTDESGWIIPSAVSFGSSRRIPPNDTFFGELAGYTLQLLSLKHKRSMKSVDIKRA